MAAPRRLDELRRAPAQPFGGCVFFAGVVIAGLLAVPLYGPVVPIIAATFKVHVLEGLPRADFDPSAP